MTVNNTCSVMIFDYLHDTLSEDKEGPKSIYSIAVTVFEANHVAWENLETRVLVQLGKTKKYTKVKESSERPYYNEFFSFEYEGSLEKMMDMILVIAVQNYRVGLRSHRLLGSARLDLGAIWTQPGHGISDKWILLTDPADPSGHIRGYINCEIDILPSGEKPVIRRFHEPTDYFIPEAQGGGRLKARYVFRIHRGVDMYQRDKKGSKLFIRILFAGLSGETTKRKHTTFPQWKEEIVFTELFPPMYNRLRIDVHFGKNRVCTKFLDLSRISDPAVKGYLPTYGPSFLHLYKPPYQYLGALLVSLETLTVHAFSESEKLLGIKRQRTQELVEKLFWNIEEFALFGVIYEVSMFQISKNMQQAGLGEFQIALGFGSNEEIPFNEGNRYLSLGSTPVFMDGSYWCLPKTETKPTIFTRQKLPDNRNRLFISNRLLHIAQEFGDDLYKIQFQVEHSLDIAKSSSIEGVLSKVIDNCHRFKASAAPGPTKLDQERYKSILKKMNKIIKDISEIRHMLTLTTQFDKCVEVYKFIVDFAIGQQESFPWVILTLKKDSTVLAYARIHTRNILFSPRESEKGLYCGKIQTFFLKKEGKNEEELFAGRIDVLLWFGPFQSVGFGISDVPGGYQDISQLTAFPEALTYTKATNFMCRVHLYQGHFLPCDHVTGTCSLHVTVHFDCKSASSSVKDVLSPIWMETLIIKNVLVYGNRESIQENPPRIILEVWNSAGKEKSILGRHLYRPEVFFGKDYLKNPQKPNWYKIHYKKHIKGEILAMFEIIKDDDQSSSNDGDIITEITSIPDYIKFRTSNFRLEVLLWGVRGSFSLPISSLSNPKVTINCGPIQLTSNSIKSPSSFPNFNQPVFISDLELPDDWLFSPPFVVRLFDTRSFGTQVFIGSHVVRNIKKFVRILPKKKQDLTVLRKSIWENLKNNEMAKKRLEYLYKESLKDPNETRLVELKYDVTVKNTSVLGKVSGTISKWARRIFCCFYPSQEEEDMGYISLGLVGPVNDPDTEEFFFDWWTKYFDSHPLNSSGGKDVGDMKNRKGEGDYFYRRKTAGISFYSTELENVADFERFEDLLSTFRLTKTSWKRQNDAGRFKGSVALYQTTPHNVTMEGHSLDEGLFSGIAKELGAVVPLIVRVYIVRAHRLSETERIRSVNSFVEIYLTYTKHQLSDSKNPIKNEINPVFGRCFELKATLPFDSTLTVRLMNKTGFKLSELIGETHIDIENRYYSRHRGTCGLQKVYSVEGYNVWRDPEKPSEILMWKCASHNLPVPEYGDDLNYVTLAGQMFEIDHPHLVGNDPVIIKENLALSVLLHWEKIPISGCKILEEHVETRSLYSPLQPGVEKGKVEMWIDLFSGNTSIPPKVNITPRIPEPYELRAIVWSTRNIKLVDAGQAVGKKNTDIFVKGWLRGKEDLQKTDVHYASMTGEGSFNWRFIFCFSYDRQEKMMLHDNLTNKQPPILSLQVWDSERLGSNRFLGALSLDLRDLSSPSKRFIFSKKYIPIKGWKRDLFRDKFVRGCWPFLTTHSDGKKEQVGMVDLELSLLTSLEAERSPAGHGRNDPDALPAPVRPVVRYTVWIVPFRAIKNYLWTYHKAAILKGLLGLMFVIFMLVMIYALPNYSVKKILRA